MCSSWLFVVQSTMVFGRSERGSAAKPTMTSLARARSWACAGTAAARSTPTRATRVVRRMVVDPPWRHGHRGLYGERGPRAAARVVRPPLPRAAGQLDRLCSRDQLVLSFGMKLNASHLSAERAFRTTFSAGIPAAFPDWSSASRRSASWSQSFSTSASTPGSRLERRRCARRARSFRGSLRAFDSSSRAGFVMTEAYHIVVSALRVPATHGAMSAQRHASAADRPATNVRM